MIISKELSIIFNVRSQFLYNFKTYISLLSCYEFDEIHLFYLSQNAIFRSLYPALMKLLDIFSTLYIKRRWSFTSWNSDICMQKVKYIEFDLN